MGFGNEVFVFIEHSWNLVNMEANLEDVAGQGVQSFGLNAEIPSLIPMSREATNPVASFLAGLCGGSDSSDLGEGQQALNLSPELLAQITAALSNSLVSTNTAATQTDHPREELPIPETSVSPPNEASLSLPATLPNITGDLSHVLQQDSEGCHYIGAIYFEIPINCFIRV